MVVVNQRKLVKFYSEEKKSKVPLLKWRDQTEGSDWSSLSEIKETFSTVDYVGNDRYVFDIGGNKYRVVAMIHFSTRTLYLKFVGIHKQYDKIYCKPV